MFTYEGIPNILQGGVQDVRLTTTIGLVTHREVGVTLLAFSAFAETEVKWLHLYPKRLIVPLGGDTCPSWSTPLPHVCNHSPTYRAHLLRTFHR